MKTAALGAAVLVAGALVLGPAGAAMASPTVPRNPQAPAGIGTGQVIVLRPHRADLVSNRVVVRVVPLPGGPVGLDVVIRAIGDSRWASNAAGVATLDAGLVQRPGTTLDVDSPIRTLRLVDSATSPAYLSGSGATVDFDGVRVVSAAGSGTAAESPHRPYVRYTHSTVTATSSTFQALGSRTVAGATGVDIGTGSTLTASGTEFDDNGIGLDLAGAAHAVLTGVTATGNGAAGVMVNRVGSVDLNGLTADGNAIGLDLFGAVPIRMDRVTLQRNAIGLEASALAGISGAASIGPVATDHNTVVGIALTNCPRCLLHGAISTGDTAGLRLDARSTGVTVQDSTIGAIETGIEVAAADASIEDVQVVDGTNGTGIRIDDSATGVHVTRGTVTGGATGLSIDGAGTTVTGTTVTGATTAVLVGSRGTGTTINQVTTANASTGLVIDGDAGTVTVTGFSTSQGGGTGIRSGAADVTIVNPTISGAVVGLDLKGGVTVNGGIVTGAAEAVRVGANGHAQLIGVELQAHVLGLRIADSAHVSLIACTVSAPLGARGHVHLGKGTHFPALPLRWLGIGALVALAFAAFLETLRRLRERSHDRSVTAPAHVLNVA